VRAAIGELIPVVGVKAACLALDVPRASFYRKRTSGDVSPMPAAGHRRSREDDLIQDKPDHASALVVKRFVPRALVSAERAAVLACLHEERFQNCAPAAIYATLLDEGLYHCSIRTMYRILAGEGEARERRDQLVHPAYTKPELLATGPNQLWSWDITKLLGPAKWTYFYLYVILDVFSRYVVGWMVADGESAELAKRLIADTCAKQGIEPGQLTIHADRGSSMTSKPVAFLMADLGVTKTHSRPHVSDDNPYSESQFRTLKYRPGFPETLRLAAGRAGLLAGVLRLVQRGASPFRARPSLPGRGSLWSRARRHRTAPCGAGRGLQHSSGTFCSQAAAAASGANGGLDQQAAAVINLKAGSSRQGDAQGGLQRSGLKSLLRGEPQHRWLPAWLAGGQRARPGGNPPAPACPGGETGKGRSNSLRRRLIRSARGHDDSVRE